MKTIFTLLAGSLFSLAALATDFRSSQLTVTVQDRGNYKVIVDGKKFESFGSSVIINNVDPGYHTVTISKFKVNPLFGILGMRTEILYNSTIQVRPNTSISLTVDRFGKAFIDEQKIRGNGRDRDDDYYDNDRGNGRDKNWKDKDDRNSGYGTYNAYVSVMSNVEFQRVLDCIQAEWFESNKMKSASQIIATNYFTSSQVKQMVQLFSFESNKLELAKQAYSKTVDKQNYQCVAEVLMFRSSKEELARFIRDCH